MKLYDYWRSSAAFRVRIALRLKGLEAEQVSVNLLQQEQKSEEYLALNPVGLVPVLELDDGRAIFQSTAILQWLEDNYPEPALMPTDSFERARVTAWAQTIACDIHPLNNVAVTNFLQQDLGISASAATTTWYYHWLKRGFDGLEAQVGDGPYCHGEHITLADVYLVPQVYNALRFRYDMDAHPRLMRIRNNCMELPAFQAAVPEEQPDAS